MNFIDVTRRVAVALAIAMLLGACPGEAPVAPTADSADTMDTASDLAPEVAGDVAPDAAPDVAGPDLPPPTEHTVTVTVTLDDVPTGDVLLVQGGTARTWRTGPDGVVQVTLDMTIDGDIGIVASHPEARTWAETIYPSLLQTEVTIAMTRYDPTDNPEYIFQDPGEPDNSPTTAQCGHCHITINEAWYASEHRTAANNPRLHDIYSGRAAALADSAACADALGAWVDGQLPGTDEVAQACYAGPSALADMNGGCTPGTDCETTATEFGGCANCHAPGIDGQLGGRNLLEAKGLAYDYGVHCDICHKVDSVDLASQTPGVGGMLNIHRPSEQGSISLGAWRPLQFGPNPDVPNIRMGNVPREHFEKADLCAGCHELEQPVLVAGTSIDSTRWPSGRLPIHSTYSEWKDGPMNPGAPCQSCHMPPDPDVLNSADLQLFGASVGIVGGWERPPGAVRRHSWLGPRAEGSKMLENAAALFVDVAVGATDVTATVTTKNVGPGHAIPTGEPMRSMVLLVQARCAGTTLSPTGGDAVPDYGGAVATQDGSGDWNVWPNAEVGDVIRVVARPGGFHDYAGFGPFGDGTFDASAKGLAVETVVGEVSVTAVAPDGAVTLDGPLPGGDVAYLTRGDSDFAGLPGMAFARVLVGADGSRMVPHHAAVDIASDNRLLPQQAWTSVHTFETTCAEPTVTARLLHLDAPARLSRAKGWTRTVRTMTEVTR